MDIIQYHNNSTKNLYRVQCYDLFDLDYYSIIAYGVKPELKYRAKPKVKNVLLITDIFENDKKYSCAEALRGVRKLKKYTNEKIYKDFELQLKRNSNYTLKEMFFIMHKDDKVMYY